MVRLPCFDLRMCTVVIGQREFTGRFKYLMQTGEDPSFSCACQQENGVKLNSQTNQMRRPVSAGLVPLFLELGQGDQDQLNMGCKQHSEANEDLLILHNRSQKIN